MLKKFAPHFFPLGALGGRARCKIEFSKKSAPQLNFQKNSRPFFFNPRGPWVINPWGPRGPIKNTFKNKVKLTSIYNWNSKGPGHWGGERAKIPGQGPQGGQKSKIYEIMV